MIQKYLDNFTFPNPSPPDIYSPPKQAGQLVNKGNGESKEPEL